MSVTEPSPAERAPTPGTRRASGVEMHLEYMRLRREEFIRHVDLTSGRGLEVGPLDAAISNRATDDVRYVDVFGTEEIRAHYADVENVILELVPHIDYPIISEGVARPLAEAVAPGGPYDWIVASHVIEHVPDVIGWLKDLAEVAVDGAALLLAVPDRRYSFDRLRPPTTAGQAIEAHELGATRPSTRAVYDNFNTVAVVDTPALWLGGLPPARSARYHGADDVAEKVARARAGEYVDCHVWTFTPWALVEQIQDWREFGLCDWYVELVEPQEWREEFLAVLRRGNRDGTPLSISEPVPPSDSAAWLHDETATLRLEIGSLKELVAAQQLRVAEQREELERLRGRVRGLRRRNQALRERLELLDVPVAVRIRDAVKRRLSR